MKQALFLLISVLVLMTACGSSHSKTEGSPTEYNSEQNLPGDSTIYGLACEGCTDSVIIFLPFSGGDPDTFSIIKARQERMVFGRPDIGDEMAVVLNRHDKSVADVVINLDVLKGEWCYFVHPHLRSRPDQKGAPHFPASLPDSLREAWSAPREYGIDIRREYTAHPIGMVYNNDDKTIPVEYPPVKQYREWRIFNGHLILKESKVDSLGNHQVFNCDTADILLLRRDTMVLRFADSTKGYYRR